MTQLTYRLRERIGRGATAEVFAGVGVGELGFEKEVAIKRLLAEHVDDETSMEQFVAEAQLVSQLHHEGIVEVIDFGVWDGLPFQVLELIEGLNLKEALKRAGDAPVPLAVALHIVREVAIALDYVHHATNEAGKPLRIVHRDINPSNVMVSWTGHVKVTDFGIARAFRRRRYTEAGVVRGTLQYMAPEQLRAEPVSPRTDIFALGCVLHELAAGASPLEETIAREHIVAGRNIDLSTLPEALQSIVDRATRVRPAERYTRAMELAEACQSVLQSLDERDARQRTAGWLADLTEDDTTQPPEPYEIGLLPTFDGETRRYTAEDLAKLEGPTVGHGAAVVHDAHHEVPTLHEEEETRLQRKLPIARSVSETIPTADGEQSILNPETVPLDLEVEPAPTRLQTPTSVPPTVRRRGPTDPLPAQRRPMPAWVSYLILAGIAVGTASVAYVLLNAIR